MFNVHLYEQKLKLKSEVDRLKDDFIKGQQKRKEKQNELAINYKKRVENFVINMLENPIINSEYKGPTAYKIRDEHPEKFLKDPNIYIKGFKHEKDRIKEQFDKNQDLDYMPNQTVAHYQFRDRDMSKEIQQDMRFTAKTSLERIEQLLKDHMQTQVENIDFRDKKNKPKKFVVTFPEGADFWERRRIVSKEIAKNLLPSLHNKTHFCATESLFNNCPVSLCDKMTRSQANLTTKIDPLSGEPIAELLDDNLNKDAVLSKTKSQNKLRTKDGKDANSDGDETRKNARRSFEEANFKKSKDQKMDQMEAFNPIETSKKVLTSCQVIKKKNPKVKHIPMGQGHLISTLDKSIADVYHELYHKDIAFPSIYQ